MEHIFKAKKITDRVYWVGAIDWSISDFHGYNTNKGTTYNAFLVLAEKVTLIDTVKSYLKDELISRISSIIEPQKIDYIISNHAEMDHSGSLEDLIGISKPEKVFASVAGIKALNEQLHTTYDITPVKSGEKISLGNMNMTFIETKMLHWPDSMFSYLHEEEILFSQDAFGMHLASSELFADEIKDDILHNEGAKYYANILLPFSSLVLKLLVDLPKYDLPLKLVAPDHGPIWRTNKDISKILGLYKFWAEQKMQPKVSIIYDTMWQSTSIMAKAISEGIISEGINTNLLPLSKNHRSDVITEILDSGAIVIGSPTLNNNILPRIADVLTYIRGLKPINKIACAFGSYGWSGESIGILENYLKEMKINIACEGLKVKFVPDVNALERCVEHGRELAKALKVKLNECK
ncbi:MAG: flavodoxin domain-containing protein [Candidatus Coatesbacteria bacterium]|nr:flavodoxin domain-containing protein [Candidatus Coatesbacteria bacterium]